MTHVAGDTGESEGEVAEQAHLPPSILLVVLPRDFNAITLLSFSEVRGLGSERKYHCIEGGVYTIYFVLMIRSLSGRYRKFSA